jgi:hypothetical protein
MWYTSIDDILQSALLRCDLMKEQLLLWMLLLAGCKQIEQPIAPADLAFDRYKESDRFKGGDNYADGGTGRLRYDDGCLYLDENGGKTGLVMPANAKFNGKILSYKGEKYNIGTRYATGGVLIKSSAVQSFNCRTPYLILVNSN